MSSPFGPLVLICNAGAGNKGVAEALPAVRTALEERDLAHTIAYTEGPGHGIELARESIDKGIRFLVAMGGDGTIHEVVNGMMPAAGSAGSSDAVLGVVAAGTGSDFVKTFGLPTSPRVAVSHLDGDGVFSIDIGKITYAAEAGAEPSVTRYFANIAEVGFGPEVVARAARLPRSLGPTVYVTAFWTTMGKFKPAHVTVDLVDRTYEGKMSNMVIANCQFFGGGMKVAPKAAPTDGLLDIQIDHTRKKEAVALMPKVFKGEHVPHPDIEEFKRVKASITSDRPLRIEADGEVLGYTPATFEVVPEAISLKV